MSVSAREALTPDEAKFCRVYAGFKMQNAPEAYRRSHYVLIRGSYYERADVDDDGSFVLNEQGDRPAPVDQKKTQKRAAALLKQPHITAYLEEIAQSTSEHARAVLSRQVLFGDDSSAQRAAREVLAQEDKLGFRDAVLLWAQIMCEIGTKVRVELPERFRRTVVCKHCGEESMVDEPIHAEAPLEDMFPQFKETEE